MADSEPSTDLDPSDPAREMADLVRDAGHVLSILEGSGVGFWSLDLATGRWTFSDRTRSILGRTDRGAQTAAAEAACLAAGSPDGGPRAMRSDAGEEVWLESASRAVLDPGGNAVRIVGTLRDVTLRRRGEAERDANESRLDAALTVGRMVIWDLDIATGIVTRSANAEEVLGSRREPITDFFARIHPDDRSVVDWETAPNPVPPTGDVRFRYRHPDGREMWLETSAAKLALRGKRGHIIGLTTDVTERHRAEERLRWAAEHDPLTGLLNRKAWSALVERVTAAPTRAPHRLLVFDVDHFKAINDGLGHDAGDAVLLAIAERLGTAAPGFVAAARLGGDEFAALLAGGGEGPDVARAVDACVAAVARPVAIGGRDVPISVSVGVARFPEDGATSADLAKNADLALYTAKAGGRKRASLFAPAMRAAFDARLSVVTSFRDGLATGAVVPFYQPKIDLATRRLVGFEALARWIHPERGVLTPAVFAPAFEDADLARRLGAVMRAAALADARRWLDRGLPVGRIAVNVAAAEFADGEIGHSILREVEAAGVPVGAFEIEVTEGVMVDRDAASVSRTMATLREGGVSIALDDFGTGFASLIHLKRFPVDAIKIDRSFVAGMTGVSDGAIVGAIIAMGRSLGIRTVAEGVETADQEARLSALGCDQAQGFLFAKPMHAARVPWFVGRAAGEGRSRRGPTADRRPGAATSAGR